MDSPEASTTEGSGQPAYPRSRDFTDLDMHDAVDIAHVINLEDLTGAVLLEGNHDLSILVRSGKH